MLKNKSETQLRDYFENLLEPSNIIRSKDNLASLFNVEWVLILQSFIFIHAIDIVKGTSNKA